MSSSSSFLFIRRKGGAKNYIKKKKISPPFSKKTISLTDAAGASVMDHADAPAEFRKIIDTHLNVKKNTPWG